ncbi:hypothetical protein [Novosphingobium sp. CECT 9465]|uniref:hypothetical protein n=1 Tax=Novosphingobium sp. CECT 9465 TaxID=2829794 RepID=UPI001E50D8E6|nr:hypothetical protein [Novosphingobium sp. CECT 9465]
MRRTTWADVRIDAISLASASKNFRAMRSGVIGMQLPEKTMHWIFDFETETLEQRLFRQQSIGDCPSASKNRRCPKTHVEAENASAPDVDEQGHPRSAQSHTVCAVDKYDVGGGVIHLDHIEQTIAVVFPRVRLVGGTPFRTHETSLLRLAYLPDYPLDRSKTWNDPGIEAVVAIIGDQQITHLLRRFPNTERHFRQNDFFNEAIDRHEDLWRRLSTSWLWTARP